MATKSKKFELHKLSIEIKCPRCNYIGKPVDATFNSQVQECEICGEHGSIEVIVECPKCNLVGNIVLKIW